MTGIALMPTTSGRCVIPSQHQNQVRPPAAYIVFADPCQTRRCGGQLWCNGHPICLDCGMGVREGRLVYTRPEIAGQSVDVAAITSAPQPRGRTSADACPPSPTTATHNREESRP